MVIDEINSFELSLKAIAHYLNNLTVVDESVSIISELKKEAKDLLVHEGGCFAVANTVSDSWLTLTCVKAF